MISNISFRVDCLRLVSKQSLYEAFALMQILSLVLTRLGQLMGLSARWITGAVDLAICS